MDSLKCKAFLYLCRVCMEPKRSNEYIKAELNLLVKKYLLIYVEKEKECFPKTICKECAATLQDFHYLYLTAEKTTADLVSEATAKITCEGSFESEEAQIDAEVIKDEEGTISIQPMVSYECCFAEDDEPFVPMAQKIVGSNENEIRSQRLKRQKKKKMELSKDHEERLKCEIRWETPEQRRFRLEKQRQSSARLRALESQEKRAERLRKDRERTQERLKRETPEQRRLRLDRDLECKKRAKASQSQEKREAELKRKREYYYKHKKAELERKREYYYKHKKAELEKKENTTINIKKPEVLNNKQKKHKKQH